MCGWLTLSGSWSLWLILALGAGLNFLCYLATWEPLCLCHWQLVVTISLPVRVLALGPPPLWGTVVGPPSPGRSSLPASWGAILQNAFHHCFIPACHRLVSVEVEARWIRASRTWISCQPLWKGKEEVGLGNGWRWAVVQLWRSLSWIHGVLRRIYGHQSCPGAHTTLSHWMQQSQEGPTHAWGC